MMADRSRLGWCVAAVAAGLMVLGLGACRQETPSPPVENATQQPATPDAATVVPATDAPVGSAGSSACDDTPREWFDRWVAVTGGGADAQVIGNQGASRPWPSAPSSDLSGRPPQSKIHPVIKGWIEDRLPGPLPIVVVLDDGEYQLPGLPQVALAGDEGPIPPAVQACIDSILDDRAALYDGFLQTYQMRLPPAIEASGVERFWLAPALAVTATSAANIDLIARDKSVVYIEPNETGYGPASGQPGMRQTRLQHRQQPRPAEDVPVEDVLEAIGFTPAFIAEGTSKTLALLDTGVNPPRDQDVAGAYDCVEDGVPCTANQGFPSVDAWKHGTLSVAVLRGLGVASIRSYRVYGKAQPLDPKPATVPHIARGFQAAVANANNAVILAQVQPEENPASGLVARNADSAFDVQQGTNPGRVIVAPAGNLGSHADNGHGTGPWAWLMASPASAHKALAIGAYDLSTGDRIDTQRIGHVPDGRVKPDLLFPTNITVDNELYDKTSGGAAVAAAATENVRKWMEAKGKTVPGNSQYEVSPGEVYAFMLNGGDQAFNPIHGEQGFSPLAGGGKFVLHSDAAFAWGQLVVTKSSTETTITLPSQITIPARSVIDATIWWPEAHDAQQHTDLDLAITNGDQPVDVSNGCLTVFEHARSIVESAGGSWALRVSGSGSSDQAVYWAVSVRPESANDTRSGIHDKAACSQPPQLNPRPTPTRAIRRTSRARPCRDRRQPERCMMQRGALSLRPG